MVEKCEMILSNYTTNLLHPGGEKCKMLISNYTINLPHPSGGYYQIMQQISLTLVVENVKC